MSVQPTQALQFIRNDGQFDAGVRYRAYSGAMQVDLHDSEIRLETRYKTDDGRIVSDHMGLRFEGALADGAVVGEHRRQAYANYFLGNDPATWRSRVPTFEQVRYEGIYPGVDVIVRKTDTGIEYDIDAEPGADLSRVPVVVDGASAHQPAGASGTLHLRGKYGVLEHGEPAAYTENSAGVRKAVPSRMVLISADTIGYELSGDRVSSERVVIDPQVNPLPQKYCTYLEGSEQDVNMGSPIPYFGASRGGGSRHPVWQRHGNRMHQRIAEPRSSRHSVPSGCLVSSSLRHRATQYGGFRRPVQHVRRPPVVDLRGWNDD